ncbi:MAG: HU family DNA-binding protein [Calditrichaeota bacterium]|nr:HU family DNA-binding protein [Candidatus Cloacimonadota bacterium]MCA9785374.1 HU family DNA-binding protein [Candidatus Cloacimonadota bacterium]MCB1046433.1 HU family DNA-binding protein [Calditrichota bacterium]MCB9474212.1 HU family DNA-binding protein [Candidatus Delongbacteria bacterium]
MRTFIKKDIVELTMERTGLKQPETARTVDALFTVLREIMSGAGPECRIEVRDFGVFEVKRTKAKPKARNPKTNEIVYVPPRRKTHFRPGKLLKESLRMPLDDEDGDA